MGMDDMGGVRYRCKIDGKMDGDLYVKILDGELQESIRFYDKIKDDIIFQQDDDLKHTCKKGQTMVSRPLIPSYVLACTTPRH